MSIKNVRRHRKHRAGASHFALVPFIDMMTILVVFLLAHTADVDILPNTKNITIPQSLSDRKPSAAVVVMITKDTVYVDGQPVGTVAQIAANPGPVFQPLKAALMAQNDRMLSGEQKADISKREVTIMGDKDMPYSLLKRIMLTCSDAEYGKVSFAVVERERAHS
jgi:biopolymer transport protein TolR